MPHVGDVVIAGAESLFALAELARFNGLRNTDGT
jgi:hypothetical protein